MVTSTLMADGQLSIPGDIRTRLALKAGDRLSLWINPQGDLVVRPQRPTLEPSGEPKPQQTLGRVPGLLRHLARNRPVSVEEMNQAVKERAAAKFRDLTDDRT